MPNPRKRPRMPKLPLQNITQTQTTTPPPHIKLRPPPRIPSLRNHIPDPIRTPNFTSYHSSPKQPYLHSPLPNQSPVRTPHPHTPVLPTPRASHIPHPLETPLNGNPLADTPSVWSGGLFSAHRPLTLDTLHPTPPTDRTDLTFRVPVEPGHPDDEHVGERYDARVRRLSFGGDIVNGKEPVVVCQPSKGHGNQDAHISREQRKRDSSEFVESDTRKTRRRRRSLPDERHVTQDRYQSSQTDDIESVEASPTAACLSEAGEVLIPETPLPQGSIHNTTCETPLPRESLLNKTPETTVRRCRAPVWDGPITQIPETPLEQLPPREAPVYVVRTAITASVEPPSLEMSSGVGEGEGGASEERRMGLLWLDIGGGSVRDNGDDTRLGEDSDSASTEPPSPTRKEIDSTQCRAQVFCRSVRVSIPAGGFRSPSPEPSLTES